LKPMVIIMRTSVRGWSRNGCSLASAWEPSVATLGLRRLELVQKGES
jgi:hypothetical protein